MKKHVSGRRVGGEPGAPAATMSERLDRLVRPGVERLRGGLKDVREALSDLSLSVREKVEGAGGIAERFDLPLSRLRWARETAADIATYAYHRVRGEHRGTVDPVAHALKQILLDASNQLIEAKKDVAVCIADRNRMRRDAALEAANAVEWARRAELAERAGDLNLARESRARVTEHERLHERLRADAEELSEQVDSLKNELRSFHRAIEDAKLAANVLRASEMTRKTRERTERQLRRIQELVSALTTMSALRGDDESDDEG